MAEPEGAEPGGLAAVFDTIYQEAFAYQSVKIIKIQDSRLTSTSFSLPDVCTIGIFNLMLFDFV